QTVRKNNFAPAFDLTTNDGKNFRVHVETIEIYSKNFRLLIFYSLENNLNFLQNLQIIFIVVVPLTLLLAAIGGYFLARKSLAPVTEMSRVASNISAKNLHERLPVKNEKDELGTLAATFNLLLERLENSFERQRRFMADASHELRTPLAIVRGESEVSLSKDNRQTEDYRESLAVVRDESVRLTKIVEDLFTLARADSGQFQIRAAEIYLDEILTDSARSVRVLAERKNVSLELKELPEMFLHGDEQLLRRLFLNLLDNAVKYNRDGGKVKISAEISTERYRILISDTGKGIKPDEQTKIFERFYRGDKSRSRNEDTNTSGAGLGLSIAFWIAEIHHADLKLLSSDDSGSIFAVDFFIK
ncbi:MAG: ATP-binding protein, partial [Pyrinomonadaceae bacterium]